MNSKHTWKWMAGGFLLMLLAALFDHVQFARSSLFAFILWLSVSLGALSQLMLHHLTGGRWGFVIRRILEAALVPLPMLALLFAIVMLGLPELRRGTGYFLPRWMALRAVGIFAIWFWMAWMLRSRSLEQDRRCDFQAARTLRNISGPGLVLYFVTVSFAMTDWLMELEPGWRSTIFPTVCMATQTLFALAGGTALAARLLPARSEHAAALANTQAWHDLGKLLFAFIIFWTYVSFAQLLIVWSGNLPSESIWYGHRSQHGWQWIARAIAIVCFFGPAAVLLSQAPKKKPETLAPIAAAIWISQTIYLFWVVAPAFSRSFRIHWMDIIVPAAVGCLWVPLFWIGWRSAAPLPLNDPRLVELGISAV